MERTKVASSNIMSIGYEDKSKTLEVEFKNGSIYQYSEVEKPLFESFLTAESKGRFFTENVRHKGFKYALVPKEERKNEAGQPVAASGDVATQPAPTGSGPQA